MVERKNWVRELLPYIIVIIVVLFIKAYIVAPVLVDGPSMYPTLHNNDLMILNKLAYRIGDIKRFDIVVLNTNDKKIVKRIIGLPGETIKVKDNILYINDEEVKESFLNDDVITADFDLYSLLSLEKIPQDKYFVMGDNRKESLDSRSIGLIDKDQIMGRASYILYPFNRFGKDW